MRSDTDKPFRPDTAWAPSLSCATWNDAHQTAAAMQRGGVLLRTPTPPPVGAGVHLTLRFPDGSDVVLVGDVLEIKAAQGAVVRFRVAAPILSQLESRASGERRPGRPAPPLARGTVPASSDPPTAAPADPEAGTTYSIHRRKK